MKKRIACLLTALVVLSCATPVLAAPSAEAEQPEVKVVATVDGKEVELKVEQEVVESVKADAKTEAAKVDAKAEVVAVVDVKFEGEVPEGGVVLTLSVDGIKAGDNVVLLHQLKDGSWEKITPSEVKDGAIVAKFTSLSPVAIVKLADAATTETAPKAGASLVLPVAALVCAAGATVCGRKVKFN